MIEITTYLRKQSEKIESQLNILIPPSTGPYEQLYDSARYALLGNGKRLRPILTLATIELLGGDSQVGLSPACTLEMIHTYSLIHDDLPCMDNDDYRRGKLTVHRKYKEGHAVLTGDYLLTFAFEILATDSFLSPLIRTELIATLAHYSGAEGMIGGQVMDLASENQTISLETLYLLQRNKTAALITASVEFGGIIMQANEIHRQCLKNFGEKIGLAFQIIDDILDITASEIKHGRTIASDILKEKSTYVSLLGLEKAKLAAADFYQQAIASLKELPYDTSLLEEIARFVINREY